MPGRCARLERSALALIALGALCRLAQWAANRSIWHDEAYVVLNVLAHGYAGLLGALDWHEPSPPAFLVVEKAIAARLGASERVWRLLPLLAGLVSLPLFALVARSLAGRRAALLALAVFAVSPKLVAQAAEIKHFTLDLVSALAITAVALRRVDGDRSPRVVAAYAALGVIAPWLSYASVLVIAGTGGVLAIEVARRRDPREIRRWALAAALVAGSLALLAFPVLAQRDAAVVAFWADAFPDRSSPLALLGWLGRAHVGLAGWFWPPFGVVVLSLAVLGALTWRRDRLGALALLLAPVAAALAAALLRLWPYGGNQHASFAAAPLLVLAARGWFEVAERVFDERRAGAALAGAILLGPGFLAALWHVVAPRTRHEVRPVLAYVRARAERSDQLLMFCPAEAEYYLGRSFRDPPAPPDPARPVWFIATRSGNRPFPQQPLLDSLRASRPELAGLEAPGAAAYRFGPSAAGPR